MGEPMKIPSYFKREVCYVCGKPCVKMARGVNYYDVESGSCKYLVVCYECDKKLGDLAYIKAVRNKEKHTPLKGISSLKT
jgi:hypothetical protein